MDSVVGQVLRLVSFTLRWRLVPRWSRFSLSLVLMNTNNLLTGQCLVSIVQIGCVDQCLDI